MLPPRFGISWVFRIHLDVMDDIPMEHGGHPTVVNLQNGHGPQTQSGEMEVFCCPGTGLDAVDGRDTVTVTDTDSPPGPCRASVGRSGASGGASAINDPGPTPTSANALWSWRSSAPTHLGHFDVVTVVLVVQPAPHLALHFAPQFVLAALTLTSPSPNRAPPSPRYHKCPSTSGYVRKSVHFSLEGVTLYQTPGILPEPSCLCLNLSII